MNNPFVRSFLEKLKEPLLPTHLANLLLALIVTGCVANARANEAGVDGGASSNVCGFDRDEGLCSFSTLIGVVSFLLALIFVIVEAQWEKLGSYHRWIYLGELIVSGIFGLLFFVSFCMLASGWSNTNAELRDEVSHGNVNVAISSSFFSVVSWATLGYFSYKGYKEDDIGGMERLGSGYLDPVTSSYHQGSTV